MVQWTNFIWNGSFLNPPSLPVLCEICRPIHLAQPGLTAGRLSGRCQKSFKFDIDQNNQLLEFL